MQTQGDFAQSTLSNKTTLVKIGNKYKLFFTSDNYVLPQKIVQCKKGDPNSAMYLIAPSVNFS